MRRKPTVAVSGFTGTAKPPPNARARRDTLPVEFGLGMADTIVARAGMGDHAIKRFVEGAPSKELCRVLSRGTFDEVTKVMNFEAKRLDEPYVKESNPKMRMYPIHMILQNSNLSDLKADGAVKDLMSRLSTFVADDLGHVAGQVAVIGERKRNALWVAVSCNRKWGSVRALCSPETAKDAYDGGPSDSALFENLCKTGYGEEDKRVSEELIMSSVYTDETIGNICDAAINELQARLQPGNSEDIMERIGYCLMQLGAVHEERRTRLANWASGLRTTRIDASWATKAAHLLDGAWSEADFESLVKGADEGSETGMFPPPEFTANWQLWTVLTKMVTLDAGTATTLLQAMINGMRDETVPPTDHDSGVDITEPFLDTEVGFELMRVTIENRNKDIFDLLMKEHGGEQMEEHILGERSLAEIMNTPVEEEQSGVMVSINPREFLISNPSAYAVEFPEDTTSAQTTRMARGRRRKEVRERRAAAARALEEEKESAARALEEKQLQLAELQAQMDKLREEMEQAGGQ
tara:strand:- start:3890 stop:5458 length:1569 start_codon:yes stop_codon:yes gene_type:complete